MRRYDDLPLGDTLRLVSQYGQKFTVMEAFNGEMDKSIAKKRRELKDAGYDVDAYDEEYERLDQECSKKIGAAEDIWERERISLEYNRKKNDLAKEYLDVNLNLVTKV